MIAIAEEAGHQRHYPEESLWFGGCRALAREDGHDQVHHFENHLFGVLRATEDAGSTAAIFLTAGMLPCGGPYRLHVDMAEQLARRGMPSLRFDLSGIGESFSAATSLHSLNRAAEETSAAIDCVVGRTGVRRVVLFGLCSGADDAMYAALRDRRICGLVTMDGFAYRTGGFYRRRWCVDVPQKLFSSAFWRRRWQAWRGVDEARPASLRAGDDIREFPPREEMKRHLHALIQRDVRMHFVYTGGLRKSFNGASQFKEMFPKLSSISQIRHSYFPDLDHTAMLRRDRENLMEHLCEAMIWTAGETQ